MKYVYSFTWPITRWDRMDVVVIAESEEYARYLALRAINTNDDSWESIDSIKKRYNVDAPKEEDLILGGKNELSSIVSCDLVCTD